MWRCPNDSGQTEPAPGFCVETRPGLAHARAGCDGGMITLTWRSEDAVVRDRVQGLWVGTRLSVMERLSIASFLHHGHEYELFAYDNVEGLPAGAILSDANAILPASMIFQYRDHPSYAGFSNYFRYKLLLDKGGWWVDTDLVCVQPFDFNDPYVFSSELALDGRTVNSAGAIKAPAGSEAMAYAWSCCLARDPKELTWGETGPRLVGQTIARFGLESHMQPAQAFCPVSFHEWKLLLEPGVAWQFDDSTRAVHLWNEMWRRDGVDKDAPYAPDCLYERLKAKYLDLGTNHTGA
jgi:Alpha 1,4-glycosyltransferase conserved region/Glycosyltransferase sugar-binding region containing DXD motif